MVTTINPAEIEKFAKLAHAWWDEAGAFKPLHQFNPARLAWISEQIIQQHGKIEGLSILDVGCGGGLVCEPLARLGANVTGIDAASQNIEAAKIHAATSGLAINYQVAAAESITTTFDVVLALEIIEHVDDVPLFCASLQKLVKPEGLLIVATLNRTAKSFALAIVGAEYVLRWLPRGTHDWRKFLKPSEIIAHLPAMQVSASTGMVYNPLKGSWRASPDMGSNYMLAFKPARRFSV
jgi:2-polyprenyl-6-hydroxyphenyl methylase / 3-demethylubiquinone-9 3-methyltransferase